MTASSISSDSILISDSSLHFRSGTDPDLKFWALTADASLRFMKKNSHLSARVQVVATEARTHQQFKRNANFEKKKYEKYVPILASRFRALHGIAKPDIFWERGMGLTLLIHISNCYKVFQCVSWAKSKGMSIAGKPSSQYKLQTPENEREYRALYQYSEEGDARLISCCAELFGMSFFASHLVGKHEGHLVPNVRRYANQYFRLWNYFRRPDIMLGWAAVCVLRTFIKPKVLAVEVFWELPRRILVELLSFGKIRVIPRPRNKHNNDPSNIRRFYRNRLAQVPDSADEFDQFFFKTLCFAAPNTWIELWQDRYSSICDQLTHFSSLKYAVNESLDEDSLLFLAEASDRGVQVIHSEHNWLQQQFVGNYIWHTVRKVDQYWSLGWSSSKYTNVMPVGSLFRWVSKKKLQLKYDVLYVSGMSLMKSPVHHSGYVTSGSANAVAYIDMKQAFFHSLSDRAIKKLYYRDYPRGRRAFLGVHSLDSGVVRKWSGKFLGVDTEGQEPTVDLVKQSRLVVTDYLGTFYIQAILSDVPTVVLVNASFLYLDDEYSEIYDEFIKVGIFHLNPSSAAKFVDQILDSPSKWWKSSSVVRAREAFLDENISSGNGLISKLQRISGAHDIFKNWLNAL